MLIGQEDILLPTTMVGNYPNPRWYDGYAHSRLPVGAEGAAIVRAELGQGAG